MRGLAKIPWLAFTVEANVALAQGTLGFRARQQPFGPPPQPLPLQQVNPYTLPFPRGRAPLPPPPRSPQRIPLGLQAGPSTGEWPSAIPFARQQSILARAEVAEAPAGLNIFGESIEICRPNAKGPNAAAYCSPESAADGQPPEICFTTIQNAGATKTNWLPRFDNLDEARCQNIWEYAKDAGPPPQVPLGPFVRQSLPKCAALPAEVIDSEFTANMFAECEIPTRKYKYVSQSISEKNPFSKDEKVLSPRCQRFQSAIQSICKICEAQAVSEQAKAAIGKRCEGFPEATYGGFTLAPPDPAASSKSFFGRGPPPTLLEEAAEGSEAGSAPAGAAALLGLFAGGGVAFVALRRRFPTAAGRPLLQGQDRLAA